MMLRAVLILTLIASVAVAAPMVPNSGSPMTPFFGGGSSGPSGPPTVTALAPNSGTTAGGTPVVLTGTNFQGATAVAFGANPAASFTYVNSTTIDATSPAGSAGVINVTVTTPLGTSATGVGNQYTYTALSACAGAIDLSTGCGTPMIGIR
jgi:IPT/TIG domain